MVESADQFYQRSLPCPVQPYQGHFFPRLNHHVYIFQCEFAAARISKRQIFQFQLYAVFFQFFHNLRANAFSPVPSVLRIQKLPHIADGCACIAKPHHLTQCPFKVYGKPAYQTNIEYKFRGRDFSSRQHINQQAESRPVHKKLQKSMGDIPKQIPVVDYAEYPPHFFQ